MLDLHEFGPDESFAALPLIDGKLLCVGSITRAEAAAASADIGLSIDGLGYYLFIAEQARPNEPIEVLAKFLTETAALALARSFATTVTRRDLAAA